MSVVVRLSPAAATLERAASVDHDLDVRGADPVLEAVGVAQVARPAAAPDVDDLVHWNR